MHRHCRFSGTGDTLHNDVRFRRTADNEVLLFLDRRNDLAQNCLFILGKVFCQQFIVGDHIRIKEIF